MTDHPTLTIGDVAQRSGATRRALRLYERAGLLAPTRGPNNYRRYSEADVQRACVIRELREGGLSLDAIAALFAIKGGGGPPADRLRATRDVLGTMQRDLERQRARIDHALTYLAEQQATIDRILIEHPTPEDTP